MSIVTYHITSDFRGMLHEAAKLSCDFWNKFIEPDVPTVIRLGTFTSFGNVIARAYRPYKRDGVMYGVVEFNTNFLKRYTSDEIVGTIIHEVGHTLGIGWSRWMEMFDHRTGKFYQEWIAKLPALEQMTVETDYGPGTTLSHWDEEKFDKELMSGFKDDDEYVLPVTISVMGLLGHKVIEKLAERTSLREIINQLKGQVFSRQREISTISRDVYIRTELWEEIYESKRMPLE